MEPALAEEPVVAPALAEEAVVEPALAEEPVVEPALAEEPAVEPALAEEPVVEPALAEEPVVEPALAEEPVVAPALAEEPVVEPALAEEPVVAPALAEEPVVEPALAEEPVVESALAEEPAVEPALAEEPVVEPALAEEPVVAPAPAEEPVVEPTLAEEPVVEPALAEEPVVAPAPAEEPVVEPALAEEPVVAPPPAEEPDPGSRCAAMVLRGLELAGVGLADEADATWGRLVSEHPSQPAAVYHYGVRAWRRGEIDDETLVTALQRVHGDHDPWELPYYLGLVHMERQDLLLASAGFENALAAGGDPVLLASLLSRAGGDHAGPCVSSRVITLEGTRRVTGVQWVASQALILDEEHLWALDPLTGTVRRLAAGRADTMASLSEGGGVVLGWRDTLAFLDLEEQTLTHEIRGAGPVSRLCASPRGHHVAFTVDGEPLVPHLWEIGADRHVLDDEALESLVSSLSSAQREALLSLRGRVFTGSELECELVGLVGGHWARARVLAATNRSVVRLHGHRAPVSALAFSGDGALLVSADAEGTLRTWGTTSGLPWGAFEHGEPVRALTVSRDGALLGLRGRALADHLGSAPRDAAGAPSPLPPRSGRGGVVDSAGDLHGCAGLRGEAARSDLRTGPAHLHGGLARGGSGPVRRVGSLRSRRGMSRSLGTGTPPRIRCPVGGREGGISGACHVGGVIPVRPPGRQVDRGFEPSPSAP